MQSAPSTAISNTLNVTKVACVRGERELFEDLTFELKAGQCIHIVGANGSGKTSLLRIMCGINQPNEGQIEWCGQEIKRSQDYLSKLAFLGHKDGLKNELTAAENLEFYHAMEGYLDVGKVDSDLAKMGIIDCADLTANKLSFGQRRRLAFAKLLLPCYALWILDEPFTGIDSNGRELIENICSAHLQNGGMIALTNHQQLTDTALAPFLTELHLS